MSVRLGVNPLTWSNDDLPSLGAETPLEQCLSEGRAVGFSGFELGNKFPREPEVLGPILEAHDLCLVSGWFSGQLIDHSVEEEIEAMQPHLRLMKELGSKVMIYCDISHCVQCEPTTPTTERPTISDPAQWRSWGKKLGEVADYVKSEGVDLAYHHHMGTLIESADDVHRMMDHSGDALGLLLDTGHMTYGGGDPVEIQRTYADRIKHMHCKDIRRDVMLDAKNRSRPFLDALLDGVFAVTGDGCVDFPEVFTGLAKSGYEGWLVLEAEQDPAVAPSIPQAQLGYDNLHRLCKNAGIEVIDAKNPA